MIRAKLNGVTGHERVWHLRRRYSSWRPRLDRLRLPSGRGGGLVRVRDDARGRACRVRGQGLSGGGAGGRSAVGLGDAGATGSGPQAHRGQPARHRGRDAPAPDRASLRGAGARDHGAPGPGHAGPRSDPADLRGSVSVQGRGGGASGRAERIPLSSAKRSGCSGSPRRGAPRSACR